MNVLQHFRAEQEEEVARGVMAGTQRSRDYTLRLFNEAQDAVSTAKIEMDISLDKRTWLEIEVRAAEFKAKLKSPRLCYKEDDQWSHDKANGTKPADAEETGEPPLQTTQDAQLPQQVGNGPPLAASRPSERQSTPLKSPTDENLAGHDSRPTVPKARSPKRKMPLYFGSDLAARLAKLGEQARASTRQVVAAQPGATPGGQGDPQGRPSVKSHSAVATSDGNKRAPEQGVPAANVPTASAEVGAQARSSFDPAYDLTPQVSEAPVSKAPVSEAPVQASFQVGSDSDSDEQPKGDADDDEDDPSGSTHIDSDHSSHDPSEQPSPPQQDGPVDDDGNHPPGASDGGRRRSPRHREADGRNAGAGTAGKETGRGTAAAPGAPGGEPSESGSDDSRKRKNDGRDRSPDRPEKKKRKSSSSSSSSSSDDETNANKTPEASETGVPAMKPIASSPTFRPQSTPEVSAAARAGASKAPVVPGGSRYNLRSASSKEAGEAAGIPNVPSKRTENPPGSYRPQSPGVHGAAPSGPPKVPLKATKTPLRPEKVSSGSGKASIRTDDAVGSSRADGASGARLPMNVDNFRKLIHAQGGAILEYYTQAVAEGLFEKVIEEHDVVAAMAIIAYDSEHGAAGHDWTNEEGIRKHFSRLPRVVLSGPHSVQHGDQPSDDDDLQGVYRLDDVQNMDDDEFLAHIPEGSTMDLWYAQALNEASKEPRIEFNIVLAIMRDIVKQYGWEHDWANEDPLRQQLLRTRSGDGIKTIILRDTSATLYAYYQRAMKDAQLSPVISEGQVLGVIQALRLLRGVQNDWANEKPIREQFTERARASRSQTQQPPVAPRGAPPAVMIQPQQQQQPPPAPAPAIPINKVQAAIDLGPDGLFDRSDKNGKWTFQEVLGEGGFGIVGLWIQRDDIGQIIGRVAVKETYLKPEQWNSLAYWSDIIEPRKSREAAVQKKLSRLPGAWMIVRYLSEKVYPDRHMYRICMEYCPLGTLEDLIRRHIQQQRERGDDGRPTEIIPRLAIRSIFEALAQAACFLERGTLPRKPSPEGWQGPIIHRDIKARNILLTYPDSVRWPKIPVTKLGDFGLAIAENADGFRNPKDLIGAGTRGTKAPEQMRYEPATFSNLHKLGSATNVFAIGRTMLNLMSLTLDNDAAALQARYDLPSQSRVDIPADVWQNYSERLINLVKRCIEPNPGHRIEATNLLQDITLIVQEYRSDFDAVPMKFEMLRAGEVIWAKDDKYLLWTK
ncbi:hypothetical protein LTR85_005609 [Meristemomyces frigidus]|nr:hypothetical protein LTR85_005609 [Meristemomyces frigidus]